MKVPVPTLNSILRSDTQGRILARILADPETGHSLSALMASSDTSMPTVIREVRRAEEAGIVETWKDGNVRRVRALTRHPPFGAMSQIILSAYGPPVVDFDQRESDDESFIRQIKARPLHVLLICEQDNDAGVLDLLDGATGNGECCGNAEVRELRR